MHTHTHKHMDTYKHALTLTLFSSKLSLSQQALFHSHFHSFSHSLSCSLTVSLFPFYSIYSLSLSLPLYRFTLSLPFLSLSLSLATVLPSHCLPPLSHSICLSSLTLCASLQFLTHSLSPFSPSHTHPFAQAAHSHHLFSSDFFRCVTFQVFFQPSIEKKRKEGLESLESTQLKSRVTKAFFGQIHIDRRSHSSKTLRGSDWVLYLFSDSWNYQVPTGLGVD